jgi:hypothetical protein
MATPVPNPMTRQQVVDAYFIEHRARILDLAAFLDRVDRAQTVGDSALPKPSLPARPLGGDDFRMAALRRALAVLCDSKPDRARRVLELFSDPSTDPIPKAPMKGATGAHDPAPRTE